MVHCSLISQELQSLCMQMLAEVLRFKSVPFLGLGSFDESVGFKSHHFDIILLGIVGDGLVWMREGYLNF